MFRIITRAEHIRSLKARKVYFIQSESGEIKIGYTNKIRNRVKRMQMDCPFKLKLLYTIPFSEMTEGKAHQLFKAHRKRGEWFNPHQDIFDFIENHKANRKTQ